MYVYTTFGEWKITGGFTLLREKKRQLVRGFSCGARALDLATCLLAAATHYRYSYSFTEKPQAIRLEEGK